MADPFTLALTIAVNVASMAMTASQKHEGPRLQDLSITVADYGTPAPYILGARRVECPCFFAERLREKKVTSKTKGGKYTEYKYYGTWANLICRNETAEVIAIYADRHLIWSLQKQHFKDALHIKFGDNLRYYRGTRDQLPDPRILATITREEGPSMTPAYRGSSYLVFEDVPLLNTGNRMPQISVIASTVTSGTGQGTFEYDRITDTRYLPDFDYYSPAFDRYPFFNSPSGKYGTTNDFYDTTYRINYETKSYESTVLTGLPIANPDDPENGFAGVLVHAIDDHGTIWGTDGRGSGTGTLVSYELSTGIATISGTWNEQGSTPPYGLTPRRVFTFTLPSGAIRVFVLPDDLGFQTLFWEHAKGGVVAMTKHDCETTGHTWGAWWMFQDDHGDIWAAGAHRISSNIETTMYLWRVTDVGGSPYATFLVVTGMPPVMEPQVAGFCAGGHFVGAFFKYGDSPAFYLVRVDLSSGTISTESPNLGIDVGWYPNPNAIPADTEIFYLCENFNSPTEGDSMFGVSSATLELLVTYEMGEWGIPAEPGQQQNPSSTEYWNPLLNAFIGQTIAYPNEASEDFDTEIGILDIFYVPGLTTVTLGDLCERIALLAGMPPEDFDFSALDQQLNGYSWNQGQAREIVSPMLDFHDSDIRPNGFIQEGLKRGGNLSGPMLTFDWMAREGDENGQGGELYKVTSISETELPRRLSVVFSETLADQQPNGAVVQRNGESVWTKREVPFDLTNLAATADDVQPRIERVLRRIWTSAVSIDCSWTPREMTLLPGHVRNIGLENGVVIRARLVQMTSKANRTIQTRWERDGPVPVALSNWEDDEGSLISGLPASPGAVGTGRPDEGFDPVTSVGWVLDVPLLSDADDRTTPFAYFAASPSQMNDDGTEADWTGAQILTSDTGEETPFETPYEIVSSIDRANYGYAYSVLAPALSSVIDNATQMVVEMVSGTLESVTETDMINDPKLNLALCGDELIQFRDAIIQSGGQYILQGLVRGARGTERHMATHEAGELFLICDDNLGIHAMGAGEIGDTDYYQVVTAGFDPEGVDPFSLLFTGEAHRPLEPVHITLVRDTGTGDWTIDALRRTRVGGSSVNGQDVPLGEVSEAYRIKVLDDYGDTISTLNVTSLPTIYTNSQQTADWGSPQTDLTISICQMSPALSLEGHPATATSI